MWDYWTVVQCRTRASSATLGKMRRTSVIRISVIRTLEAVSEHGVSLRKPLQDETLFSVIDRAIGGSWNVDLLRE